MVLFALLACTRAGVDTAHETPFGDGAWWDDCTNGQPSTTFAFGPRMSACDLLSRPEQRVVTLTLVEGAHEPGAFEVATGSYCPSGTCVDVVAGQLTVDSISGAEEVRGDYAFTWDGGGLSGAFVADECIVSMFCRR